MLTGGIKVNELSGTIDLESTLIRAEALFRKFQRLVETIDKKQNFPGPRLLRNSQSSAANGGGSEGSGKSPEQVTKIITPELRQLLSRKVEVLPRKEVAKQGDGLWGGK